MNGIAAGSATSGHTVLAEAEGGAYQSLRQRPVTRAERYALGKSLRNLEHQNFGFATEGRYLMSINPTLSSYKPEQMEPLFREIDDRLRQIPGVRMVAPVLYAPMSGEVILMSLLGGVGTFFGPVFGAGIVVALQDLLADKVGAWVTVIIGVIFVICVLAFRKGVVGELLAWRDRRRARAVPARTEAAVSGR